MKIRGSAKGITAKKLFLVSGILGIVYIAISAYQSMSLIDAKTGFFTDKSNITVPLFYILFVVFVLITLILSYICSDIDSRPATDKKNMPHALFAVLFAAALAYSGAKDISFIAKNSGLSGMGYFEYAKLNGGVLTGIAPILAVLSVLVLLVAAASYCTGKMFASKIKLCFLFPVLWAFCKTVSYFAITASYLKVSLLMTTIFSTAFLMVFLFEYARYISGIGAEDAAWTYYATGIIAAVFLFASGLSTIIGKGETVHCPIEAYALPAALFCASAVFMRTKKDAVNNTYTSDSDAEAIAETSAGADNAAVPHTEAEPFADNSNNNNTAGAEE